MKLVGLELPNIPWQDRPLECQSSVWRFSENPIILRNATPTSNSVFNSAAVPFNGAFAGVFRCDNQQREMRLHSGISEDGIEWKIDPDPIKWTLPRGVSGPEYGYDPRVVWIDDRYYITWCNGYHGPTIGIGYTEDFVSFYMIENALLPFNRNGVLFPRKINGSYMMLSRPSDNGHTPFGEILPFAKP